MQSGVRRIGLFMCGLLIASCVCAADGGQYRADIRWTGYGIPHIKAADWGSLGYGVGYAVPNDAICVLAKEFIRVNGQMARYFGDTKENIDSDAFHRALLDQARLTAYRSRQLRQIDELGRGYVAGYNRFLVDRHDTMPASCKGKPWLLAIDSDAAARLAIGVGIRYGLGWFVSNMVNASPLDDRQAAIPFDLPNPDRPALGSNAYAFGKNATKNGRGLLLGNPHYPWEGPSRFHMLHLTIPGELDSMGVGLYTTNFVAIGFNQHVAWSHTVSTAMRFTLFELSLVKGDPFSYRYGDQVRKLEPRVVSVDVADDSGKVSTVQRTIYMSHLGPVIEGADLPWNDERAYVIKDVNLTNNRSGEQYYRLNQARNVQDVRSALNDVQGVSFTNTIAADSSGQAFYADMSVIPNVSASQIRDCQSKHVSKVGGRRMVVLDASRPECDWRDDPEAAAPGLMPGSKMPRLVTNDYVTNSNDSYWLTNPDYPLEGYSPIIGDEGTARTLRTRAGISLIQEVLKADPPGKFDSQKLRDLMYGHRNFGAELLLDDILAICVEEGTLVQLDDRKVNVKAACEQLALWDRKQDVDSRGAHIYFEFWQNAILIDDLYAVPFDRRDPVHTPRGINAQNSEVRSQVMQALARAVLLFEKFNIPLDAAWGDMQYAERNGVKIGIPGGAHNVGMFSVMHAAGLGEDHRYSPISHGNSYIQVIGWEEDGSVNPHAILTYSQSQEADSAHYSDQTELYSKGGWIDLPFTEEEINADPDLVVLTLSDVVKP